MSRTAEKVLSIISMVINILSAGALVLSMFFAKILINDPLFKQEIEREFIGAGLSQAEIATSVDMTNSFLTFITNLGWVLMLVVIVAVVLTIIGLVKLKTNAKTAGILFLVASFLSGVLSIQGILLIIAGILCFTRKEEQPIINEANSIEQ